MFISRKGNTAITSRHALRILSDAARSAGLPAISTHTLRKTFADRLYDRLDGNVFEVQQALGHKSPASTIRYLGFKEKRVESAILSLFDEEDQLPLPGVAEEEYPYGHE